MTPERLRAAPLTAAQHQRVDALLDALLDLPPAERAAQLARACADDAAVATEVASLLRADADADAGDFLSAPAAPSASTTAPAEIESGARIGAWRLLRAIGYGGMGEVYEAERADGGFAQRAALKLLRPEASQQLRRFHAERQILARLEHPGIARLYDGGVAGDGRPYMAMEYVEGHTLTEHCALVRADLGERLRLFAQVCDAVAYAHHHFVVHRDLKPANILVTRDGQVKLLDFGIAKLLDAVDDDGGEQTRTLAAPLTPRYAAPEQLTGGAITTATDVYALGLLLFELLTGELPWSDEARSPALQVVRAMQARTAPLASATAAARAEPPIPPRLLRGDLDAIVAKALRAEPGHRYTTVDAMKRDVDHAQRGEAIAAREGARLYAVGRVLRRYRWAAAATAAVFVALAVGLGIAAWQAHNAAIERDLARRDAAREEALRYHLTGLFRNAIADHGGESPTAKSMLDKSAQRVLSEYRDQPMLAGQVVLTLTELYEALQDVQGTAALLEGFLADTGPRADPFAVASARQKLAGIELMRGHVEQSGKLLDDAEAYWAKDAQPHAEERLEGLAIRSRWLRAHGDFDASIATDRSTIAQRIALSGHDHRETATLFNSLAITLTAVNRLDEALAAYKETTAIYDKLGRGDSLDAQIIRGNSGTLAMRTGRIAEAESLLKGAIEHERALAGDSAAVASSMGYYAKILIATGRAREALPVLASSIDMATRYSGPTSPLTLQNRCFLGDAQLAAGNLADARATLEAGLRDSLAHYPKGHALPLRCGLALAQLDGAEHRYAAAKERLEPVIAGIRAVGATGQSTLAQALVARADIALAEGDAAPVLPLLREAVQLRSAGWDQSWELAQARERLGEALAATGSAGEARPLLKTAEATLQSQLGAEHPETVRARRALSRLAA